MSILDKLKGIPDDLKGVIGNIKQEAKREVMVEIAILGVKACLSTLVTEDPDNEAKWRTILKQVDD